MSGERPGPAERSVAGRTGHRDGGLASALGDGRAPTLDERLDAALEETFPSSDPVSITIDRGTAAGEEPGRGPKV